ncbi:MAG: TetR/AcrR family transcriptional regulator, partial [Myxococcota bacterium]
MPPTQLTTAQDRRLRHREEARRAILDATQELLVEQGYESFSMRKLASRCGYAAPTIYHYFGDKPGLLDRLIDLRMREVSAEMRSVHLTSDPVENMRRLFIAFVRWGLANPTHYQLLTSTREPHPAGEEAREVLMRPVTQLEEQGRLETDIDLARQSLWALVHGIISLQTTRPEEDWS